MGKKINIDAIAGLSDAIELTLGGRTFSISDMKKGTLDRVTSLGEEADNAESIHEVLAQQLVLLTDGGEEDMAFLLGLDGRVLKAAVTRVMEELTEAGERKRSKRSGRR